MNIEFNPRLDHSHTLPPEGSWPESRHWFDLESVWAIRTALASGRPLLVRGDPGLGKSQLARAAARIRKVPFLSQVIHSRTEASDLLFRYDAVSRLAQAQVLGTAGVGDRRMELLEEKRFIEPGILWWAFNWESARTQAKNFCRPVAEPPSPTDWDRDQGCVVLIDEIDKADGDVPNGLLECLGNIGFGVPQANTTVSLAKDATPPLVVVTTNEERELPAAFLRRCLVLHLKFPESQDKQIDYLLERARTHYSEWEVSRGICIEAAQQLLKDRADAKRQGLTPPGPAEYLDLIKALTRLHPGNEDDQRKALAAISKFALRKNPDPTEARG